MGTKELDVVGEIRSFNRFYTDILGLLNRHILDSAYSLTEVRVLYEVDKTSDCTANLLMEKLKIDKGYMSRILKHFEAGNLLRKESSLKDGRSSFLHLTPEGEKMLSELEDKSSGQIKHLIGHLSDHEQEKLAQTMKYIKNSLMDGLKPITIRSFQPADIDVVIQKHKDLYENEYGFNKSFGHYVEKYVHQFSESFDSSNENIWVAEESGVIVGIIAIVKVDQFTAQLRWFLIDPYMRGRGLGHRLMQTAIGFCKEKHYEHVLLWTVSSLDAARHLYKSYGFSITETKPNDAWGCDLLEERWDLELRNH